MQPVVIKNTLVIKNTGMFPAINIEPYCALSNPVNMVSGLYTSAYISIVPWIAAITRVRYLVYWAIFCLPESPSCIRRAKLGITAPIN